MENVIRPNSTTNTESKFDLKKWYDDYALEVDLDPDEFLMIAETLTRMGVSSYKEKKLYQSCHILYKRDRYYLVHFKELFGLDGRYVTNIEEAINKRNVIAKILHDWGMLEVLDYGYIEDVSVSDMRGIRIIKHSEKDEWELVSKYTIGSKKSNKNHYNHTNP